MSTYRVEWTDSYRVDVEARTYVEAIKHALDKRSDRSTRTTTFVSADDVKDTLVDPIQEAPHV